MKTGRRKLQDGTRVAEQARRLRARPGWNPGAAAAGPDLVEQLGALRAEESLTEAEGCPRCAALRRDGDDPGALCQEHLTRALGLEP